MSVGRLLQEKGREVFTIPTDGTLQAVVDLLAQKHVGSLVITDALGKLVGIVSERDVVRAIARHGYRALRAGVTEYMTAGVTTARDADDIDALLLVMTAGRFRHVPVLDDNRLVGIVSQGDAIKFRLSELKIEHALVRDYIAA
jgi:CBS domain-containing protein